MKVKPSPRAGVFPPLLCWGGVFALFGISKVIAEDDKTLASWVFGIGIVAWFLSPFLIWRLARMSLSILSLHARPPSHLKIGLFTEG
ncbi:hypothetical protein C2846_03150 [Pseudomonas jilinensis]|uniref:Uncharacterized protein n=1 Tax=Pseudomonas jilinensis TaxID=2078689 RepID=A0A396S1K1_9PSED|nr:hypothetical protein C2846_03150 [Pseudomonas jilinensis]